MEDGYCLSLGVVMKKIGSLFLIVSVVCCLVEDVRADLIQGDFSGIIDINGHLTELYNGASFAGQFVYDTDATAHGGWTSGGETHTVGLGAFVDLSIALVGVNNIYTYATGATVDTATYVTYNSSSGDYRLDFDHLPGQDNFIEDLDLRWAELILEFSKTPVTDPGFPVIAPDAGNLIAGSSYWGSVLYLSVEGAQINGNISSLSLQPIPTPEPATMILTAAGLVCIAGCRKKWKGFSKS